MFPNRDAINRRLFWTDPLIKFIGMKPTPLRIVGIAADLDDEHLVPGPTLTVYQPFGQGPLFAGRLFVHVRSDPYALVSPITRMIRGLSVDQPVERAATLEDVRAEVLTPDRLNAMVFGGFAIVALTIAVIGVAGVLAFSVSARTREFGIRLAIGSQPRHLLARVIAEGAVMTAVGIGAGLACGLALERLAGSYFDNLECRAPGSWLGRRGYCWQRPCWRPRGRRCGPPAWMSFRPCAQIALHATIGSCPCVVLARSPASP